MKTLIASIVALTVASSAFAAGSDSSAPPKPTETTQKCENGQIFDAGKATCVNPKESKLDDDALYNAARELAYAGQYENALNVLEVAADQNDPRILNYKGFANRKAGRLDEGMAFYQAALSINPDYILARSYMGQALAGMGDIDAANEQLAEIRNRGGRDTWAYASLKQTLQGLGTY